MLYFSPDKFQAAAAQAEEGFSAWQRERTGTRGGLRGRTQSQSTVFTNVKLVQCGKELGYTVGFNF